MPRSRPPPPLPPIFPRAPILAGTYGYIGPGVASLPDLNVDVGPLGAGVYVEPGIAFMSPAMDYGAPTSTWAPVYPQAGLEVVPAETVVEVSPAARRRNRAVASLSSATRLRSLPFWGGSRRRL